MMTTPASDASDASAPDLLRRFEQDLLGASDPAAVLEGYRQLHPGLHETFRELADAIAMLQAGPFRRAFDGGDGRVDALVPDRFGPYRVVRSIGRGGMGGGPGPAAEEGRKGTSLNNDTSCVILIIIC